MNKILKVAFVLLLAFNYNSLRAQQDGQVDTTFNPSDTGVLNGVVGAINAVAEQPDGKVLVAGRFNLYSGQVQNNITRLNNDESVDASFNAGTGANGEVRGLTVMDDGKVLVNGTFTSFNGYPCKGIARLNTNGSFDTSFVTNSLVNSGAINNVYILSNDKIIVFYYDNTFFSTAIARLNSNGSADTSFAVINGQNLVSGIAVQNDDKILVGGFFDNFLSYPVEGLARLNPNGTIDTSSIRLSRGINL